MKSDFFICGGDGFGDFVVEIVYEFWIVWRNEDSDEGEEDVEFVVGVKVKEE